MEQFVSDLVSIRSQQAFSLKRQIVNILDFEGDTVMAGIFEFFISSFFPFTLPVC